MAVDRKAKGKAKSKAKAPKAMTAAGVEAEKLAAASGDDGKDAKVENWADKPDSDTYDEASKLYEKVKKAFDNKQAQIDDCEDFWGIYSAQPSENQQYAGNSQCYIPAVRDAINARVKRSLSQLFPTNHKHVDAVGPTEKDPAPVLALMEHYIRTTKLKSVVRADMTAGDVTGQWNLYVDWSKSYRTVTEIVKKPPVFTSEEGVEVEDPTDEEGGTEKIEEREVITEGPDIVPIATEDLAVYPPTCDDIEKSTASAVKLRMSKEKVQQMIDDGVFVGPDADELVDLMAKPDGARDRKVPAKKRSSDAGVKTEGTWKYALIYEVACNLDFGNDRKEAALVYFAGDNQIVGIIKSPWWSGRRPVISAPVEKITGSFFGISKIEAVKYLQWNLNDFWNMGMDSAQYALLPIIMTDPLKNPNYQSMVMGLAAVWLADPNSTKFQEFPALWKDSMQLCNGIKAQIWESMDVNEAMMGKMPAGRKNNQLVGNMQQEQQINITDHAKRYEEEMLNPVLERMFELDQQFRTEAITVRTRGELGARAAAEVVEPQAFDQTWSFKWLGTSFQTNMQRMQQMISMMNVIRGIPPQQLDGKRLNVAPIVEFMVEQVCGPEIGPRILIDDRNMFTIPPELENDMLHNGIPILTHQADDHMAHIKAHNEAAKHTTDPSGYYRTHIQLHMKALQEKMQQQAGQQQGAPGIPGGGQPGVAGTPKPGGQVGQPRPQGPPGGIHADAMPGAPAR
jgi:hypothetical protein